MPGPSVGRVAVALVDLEAAADGGTTVRSAEDRWIRAKPSRLCVLEGNPSKRPLPKGELRHVPGWVTAVDGDTLAAYCQAYGRWTDAERVLSKSGMTFEQVTTVIDTNGTPVDRKKVVPRVEVQIARAERAAMSKLAAELGLSPASRTRISVIPPGTVDDDEDLDPS